MAQGVEWAFEIPIRAEGEVVERVVYIVTLGECVELLKAIMPREARGPFPSFDV
ncbi:hypothetical protein MK280_09700 [Myxococcota bacterium]|nr:hypothetical protein [Myxococcota bacterium]